jgi:uncharacterized protein
MAKFLLVIAVFIVFYLFLRNYARRSGKASPPHPESKHGENMVRCSVCGVHLPTSEAVTSHGDFFCSKEHLQLADRDRGNR